MYYPLRKSLRLVSGVRRIYKASDDELVMIRSGRLVLQDEISYHTLRFTTPSTNKLVV